MRVLHVVRPAGVGGCERHLVALASSLVGRGHGVGAVILRSADVGGFVEDLRGGGVAVVVRPAGPYVNPAAPFRLLGDVRRFRPDVVHTHSIAGDLYGQAAARAASVAGVSTVHGTYPFYSREPYRTAARAAGHLAERTIAISDHVRDFVAQVRIAPADRIRVVRYATDAAAWPDPGLTRTEARTELGFAPSDIVVGIASRLVPEKGHDVALHAFAKAIADAPSLRLAVAGDGPLRSPLIRRARDLLPEGVVRFAGHTDDVPRFLSACDIFVFPTQPAFGEGFGLAVLDAMASGLPVVATRVGPVQEVVGDGGNAVLVDPSDASGLARALARLASDDAERARLGAAARRRAVDAFPLERMVDATVGVYEEARAMSWGRRARGSQRSTWESMWEERQNVADVYTNEDRIRRNVTKVTDVSGRRVMEVGAGTGRDSATFAPDGAIVYQLDYAESSLRLLVRLAREADGSVHVIGGDAFNLPVRDAVLDVVFHQGLLEHFREDRAAELIREHARVLRPGGLLVVDVPQRWHPYTVLKHALIAGGRWFAGWERSYSRGELRAALTATGLEVVHEYGEWMHPSLAYRVGREAARRAGVILPLAPRVGGLPSSVRDAVRSRLTSTRVALATGISIGAIARKPGEAARDAVPQHC